MNVHPLPLTDSSLIVYLGDGIDPAINRRVHGLAAALGSVPLPGVTDIVSAYVSLTVHYDPLVLTYAQTAGWLSALAATVAPTLARPGEQIEVPVVYDGPDLPDVAAHCRLSVEEVVRLHTQTTYTVYMMGFLPGFAYLGKLPDALITPRLASPRTRVPAGSVAVAGAQTGIYPFDSPGGWRLIGRTALKPFDPQRTPPFLFAPGDTVRFVALDGNSEAHA